MVRMKNLPLFLFIEEKNNTEILQKCYKNFTKNTQIGLTF